MKTPLNRRTIYYAGGIIRPRGKRFQAEYNIGNKRRRQSFRSDEEARTWIEEQGRVFFQNGMNGFRLSTRQSQDAADALAEANGRVSLTEAVRFWLKQHKDVTDSLTVQETYDRHIAWMRETNLRPFSIDSRMKYLKPLLAEFGERKLLELTRPEIEQHIERRSQGEASPLSPRSIRNIKCELQAFFNWAEQDEGANQGFENKLVRVKAPLRDATPNEIMRPGDVVKVLHRVEETYPESVAALAIAFFAGLRSEELNQLRWDDVDFTQLEIRVRAETCKTRTAREVPIEPNLQKWLQRYRASTGLVSPPFSTRDKHRDRACKALGIRWPSNAARHSYGTYYAKHFGSYSKAADNMGHVGGIKMFMSAYKGYCTKDEAAAYWKIEPLPKRKAGKKVAAARPNRTNPAQAAAGG